jgi:endonuclease G, mitochondrial
VVLDEDYANRSGYDPDFLGGSHIPLPSLSTGAARADAAVNREPTPGRSRLELTYEHFSVVMNGRRRLASFTATNIDGALAKNYDRDTGVISDPHDEGQNDGEAAEATERWFPDRRIDETEQTPPQLYEGQTAFDASGRPITDRRTSAHRNRMFQQGHLTRRQDPLWGDDDAVVRANADTFHVTNRAPQVGFFNMGIRKTGAEAGHAGGQLHWRAMEDYVLNNAVADKARVTVFTGPIFDDRFDIPWDRGMVGLQGFKAPREFWKVILRVENGVLRATALSADQAPLIDYAPEAAMTDAELRRVSFEKVRRYHVSLGEIERRTAIDFGDAVRAADTHDGGERREIRTLDDLIGITGAKTAKPKSKRATAAPRKTAAKRKA